MDAIKNNMKSFITVFTGSFIWILASRIIGATTPYRVSSLGKNFIGSNFSTLGSIGYVLIVLSCLSILFVLIQKNLYGKSIVKGLKFGLCFAVLWGIGFFELHHFLGKTFTDGLKPAIRDAIPMITTGLLCGYFFGTDNLKKNTNLNFTKTVATILLFTVLFSTGRVIYYTFLIPNSKINTPEGIFFTIVLGACVGFLYYFLNIGMPDYSKFIRTLYFTFLVFGLNWSFYILYYLLKYNISPKIELFYLLVDLTAVITGTAVCEKYLNK
ncbi:MAG: hypothetical protein GY793_11465 [Proteobacteria bacterium]|nr:hypothetical protein [Pseudomonadota bacterium]